MKLAGAIQNLSQATGDAFAAIQTAVGALIEAARTSDRTGLRNGLALEEDLAKVHGGEILHYLLFGDLNGFKAINDKHSHEAGDAALRRVGEILAMVARNWRAEAYHQSGDEFAVIVSAASKSGLLDELEQYFVKVSYTFANKRIEASASFGCVEIDSSPLEEIQARAEIACRFAKRGGRTQVVHEWSPQDELEEVDRRFRCNDCGTAFSCTLTGEHRNRASLCCPVCQTDTTPAL